MCHTYLGVVPRCNSRVGNQTKMVAWQYATFATTTKIQQLEVHYRAYILGFIWGILMSDKTSNKVHLMYLTLLTNLRCAGRYSWGSSCLATLYREMCWVTKEDVKMHE